MSSKNVAHISIPPLQMICPMCKEKYDTSERFVEHAIEKHMEWKPFRCEECLPPSAAVVFPTEKQLRDHQLNTHKMELGKYTFHDDKGNQKVLELLAKKAIAEGACEFDKIAPKISITSVITSSKGNTSEDPIDPNPGAPEVITDSGRKHFPSVIAFNNQSEKDGKASNEQVQQEILNAPGEILHQNETPPPDVDEQPIAQAPRNDNNFPQPINQEVDAQDGEVGNAPDADPLDALLPAEVQINYRARRQPFVNLSADQLEQVFDRLREQPQPQVVRPLAWLFRGNNRSNLLQPNEFQRREIRRSHERGEMIRQRRAIDEIYGIYDANRRRQIERLNNQQGDVPRRRPIIPGPPIPPRLHNRVNRGPFRVSRHVPAALPPLPNVAISDSEDSLSEEEWWDNEEEVNPINVVEIGPDSEYEDESEHVEPPRRRARMDGSWMDLHRNNRGDRVAPVVNP